MGRGGEVVARYDGHADFYDSRFAGYGDMSAEGSSSWVLAQLLAPGAGRSLDIGCGTGLHFDAIESTGRHVIGLDISSDQLRIAATRAADLVRADAASLPFASATFDSVTCTFLHTDIDSMAPVFTEAHRVLRHAGRIVYLGQHPCFRSGNIEINESVRIVHPGYLDTGWRNESPHWRPNGIAVRVGQRHTTLSELANAVITSGLILTAIHEYGARTGFAEMIALCASKP
jgi:ubiquinone/menaquinone biosynthesis C-methylase UbiE